MSKIAVFFDIQNLYHASKNYGGSKISYKHLLDEICKDRELFSAKAYAAHKDERTSRSFYDALRKSEIDVMSKRVFVKKGDNNSSRVIPVHFDSEISVDACLLPDVVDTVVLCTGNGNFAYLADKLFEDGVNVEIWSFAESTSELLRSNRYKFVQIPKCCLLGGIEKKEVDTTSA